MALVSIAEMCSFYSSYKGIIDVPKFMSDTCKLYYICTGTGIHACDIHVCITVYIVKSIGWLNIYNYIH